MPTRLDIIMDSSLKAAMLASWLAIAAVAGCQSPNISAEPGDLVAWSANSSTISPMRGNSPRRISP
mgnify:CR=1 FL=1